ncbi:RING-H2 finger protein ATL38-like [Rhododendron vialii]|uniref:RING-H2 finger protein ATL38-like n=1 Tax=Rhododendron vialii TaxID=182163 RepID=UPI00265E5739|nr:RING-H2 finger protein ATL38-like [Rhododendron vialii]
MSKNSLHRCILQLFTSNHHLICAALLVTLALYPLRTAAQTDSPPPNHISNSKIMATPTMAVIIACFIAASFITGCLSIFMTLYCMDFRQRLTLESHGVSAPHRRRRRFRHLMSCGLDPWIIDTFPTLVYSEVKTDGISLECAVCLSEFENTDTLRLLPICCHVFHHDCIDAWLSTHVTCPVCRSNLALEPDDGFTLPSHEPKPVDSVGVDNSIVDVRTSELRSTVRTSRKERMRIGGKLWRWYSVVQEGENCERFTLRLPEEVRSRLVMNSSSLSRTRSCVNFQRARSSRKGYRSGSGGISKLGFMVATPPQKVVVVGGGEEVIATPKVVLKSVRAPLHRLIWGSESYKERVNVRGAIV